MEFLALDETIAKSSGTRKDALLAARGAIASADPGLMVRRALTLEGEELLTLDGKFDLAKYDRIIVVGWGKASALMAEELEHILGERIGMGLVVVPEFQKNLPILSRIKFETSTHPLPTEKGVRAARMILDKIEGLGKGDLIICLVSGGGSALIPLPVDGVSLDDLRQTTELLLRSGADIKEINCVRKHLSQILGGRLIEKTAGTDVLSLVVSDVAGDDLGAVSSGPTVPDPTTFAMAKNVLERYEIMAALSASIRRSILLGVQGKVSETPKPGNAIFGRTHNLLIGSNRDACAGAKTCLENRGYNVPIVLESVTGEARGFGEKLADLARANSAGGRWAALAGGETTVTVKGPGKGGRNGEVALSAAIALGGSGGGTVLSFGTDGLDGTSYAAGAIADSKTLDRARQMRLDPRKCLEENDSQTFFERLGDLVVTGPTGTNVNDVMMILVKRD